MEPRVAMSWFVVAQVLGLLLLALGGYAPAAWWTGAAVAGLSAFLHGLYLLQRRAARRMPVKFKQRRGSDLVPLHRPRLDLYALGQWIAIAVLGAGGALVLDALGARPLDHVGLVYDVLTVGWVVLWAATAPDLERPARRAKHAPSETKNGDKIWSPLGT